MKLKGIVLVVILLLASIMMPFEVYAAVQSEIVPTFSSTTSQWSTHLSVTNFSDGTNNQASSTLSFTFDDDYYGMIYFDGYGPSNQHIANFATVYVAGGYGEYRYSYYQNGVINITSITIQIVNVVKPQTTVDLTQIITLLTAIENDTTSIDNVLDTTLAQIRLVLAELIESNDYLEVISKMKEYDIPIESVPFVYYQYNQGLLPLNMPNNTDHYDNYIMFQAPANQQIGSINTTESGDRSSVTLVIGTNVNVLSSNFYNYFGVDSNIFNASVYLLGIHYSGFRNLYINKIIITRKANTSGTQFINLITSQSMYFIPIYLNYSYIKTLSTDFALRYGLTNQLLDDLHIIANGTSQSNSAATDLESSNNQMADDMDDLATIESGYNQQFNNQLQSIDFTSPIQNNAGILPAANFVISIFNGLINNNPFSVLIIVVCILLIGKKVIGK